MESFHSKARVSSKCHLVHCTGRRWRVCNLPVVNILYWHSLAMDANAMQVKHEESCKTGCLYPNAWSIIVSYLLASFSSDVQCLSWMARISHWSFNADYTLGEKKFAGNAQAITKQRFCHHTSFLWDFADSNMRLLKHPAKAPGYRQVAFPSTYVTLVFCSAIPLPDLSCSRSCEASCQSLYGDEARARKSSGLQGACRAYVSGTCWWLGSDLLQGRSHLDFLCKLKDVAPSRNAITNGIHQELQRQGFKTEVRENSVSECACDLVQVPCSCRIKNWSALRGPTQSKRDWFLWALAWSYVYAMQEIWSGQCHCIWGAIRILQDTDIEEAEALLEERYLRSNKLLSSWERHVRGIEWLAFKLKSWILLAVCSAI